MVKLSNQHQEVLEAIFSTPIKSNIEWIKIINLWCKMKIETQKFDSIKYKGYEASIEFDSDLGLFHGEIEMPTVIITFKGKNITELQNEMKKSVNEYLNFCKLKTCRSS